MLPPVKTEPTDTLLDRIDVLLLFLGRVGVIKAEITATAEIPRQAEVDAYGLGMTDVKISVRFRWETGHNAAVLAAFEVFINNGAQKIICYGCSLLRTGHDTLVSKCFIARPETSSGRPW